jgi:hypothetical protein
VIGMARRRKRCTTKQLLCVVIWSPSGKFLLREANQHVFSDLTTDHLPLLDKILKDSSKAINKKHRLSEKKLKIYFTYNPQVGFAS